MTGFRKAVKKFEKITKVNIISISINNCWWTHFILTKIPVQKQYMAEKVCCLSLIPNHRPCLVIQVGNCAFASDDGVVQNMTQEMEQIYTAVFGRLHHDVLCAYILCSHGV